MLESTLEFLRCVRCNSKLELDSFKADREIQEGILECMGCHRTYPIIEKIPILWNDFAEYLASRKVLGGQLYQSVENEKLKRFVRSSLLLLLAKTNQVDDDRTALEKRWCTIYQNSKSSKLYSTIRVNTDCIKGSNLVLEYGCSIGAMSASLAESHNMVFGVDRSFYALRHAKKVYKSNLDYVAADLLSPIFGDTQFDLVVALNVMDLVEPTELLKHISRQVSDGYVVFSDPYDFDRGDNSVKKPFDETTLRTYLTDLGFEITSKTRHPSYIDWDLRLNSRAVLNYKVDLVIAKK